MVGLPGSPHFESSQALRPNVSKGSRQTSIRAKLSPACEHAGRLTGLGEIRAARLAGTLDRSDDLCGIRAAFDEELADHLRAIGG